MPARDDAPPAGNEALPEEPFKKEHAGHGVDLGRQIDQAIALSGPMSLSVYMQLCLTHPTRGYYMTGDPLGRSGDFITAPEVSQMFGELIGVWLALLIQQIGAPRVELVELGPGRGTLMRDALATASKTGIDPARLSLTLVEASPALSAVQRQTLARFSPRWLRDTADISQKGDPLIILANEFFDALPIKQYQKSDGAWHERVVGLRNGQRTIGLDPNPISELSVPNALRNAKDGEIYEHAQLAHQTIGELAARVKTRGGAILVIDYGYARTQAGDTFQALAKHAPTDPLIKPGAADLTTHVDFESLSRAAAEKALRVHPLFSQGQFLGAMGILTRAEALSRANPQKAASLQADLERLAGPEQMGELFKVLCVTDPALAPYPFAETIPPGASRQ